MQTMRKDYSSHRARLKLHKLIIRVRSNNITSWTWSEDENSPFSFEFPFRLWNHDQMPDESAKASAREFASKIQTLSLRVPRSSSSHRGTEINVVFPRPSLSLAQAHQHFLRPPNPRVGLVLCRGIASLGLLACKFFARKLICPNVFFNEFSFVAKMAIIHRKL